MTEERKLTPEGLAAWERTLAETRERNAALVAQSVAAQRAELDAARAPGVALARTRLAIGVAALADHRARARQWAAEHPGAANRLEQIQAYAQESAK
jgi:hypothetical protein